MPYKIVVTRTRSRQPGPQLLLNLPNELILAILERVQSPVDLYNAARASTRLRLLALPLYLKYHAAYEPDGGLHVYVIQWDPADRHPDALSGLNLSTHIKEVDKLRIFFQDPASKTSRNTFQQVFHLPHAINRTTVFLAKLTAVRAAAVYLVWDSYFTLSERSINYVPWRELKKWTSALETMLNMIVERGCTSVTVQYDPAIKPPFQMKHGSKVLKYLSHGKDFDIHWQFERNLQEYDKSLAKEPEPTAVLSAGARAANKVQHLAVHSPILLTPPFLKWTLSLLHSHRNLTSLSFAYITIEADIWSAVLPFIASSLSGRLTSLSFFRNCPHLGASHLIAFIKSFPNLIHLYIDRSLRSRFMDPPQKPIFSAGTSAAALRLANLQSLQCPVEFISHIMGASNPVVGPLPSLRRLTVYPCAVTMQPSAFSTTKPAPVFISDILDRITSYTRPEAVYCALDAQIELKELGHVVKLMEEQREAINDALNTSTQATATSSSAITQKVLDTRRKAGLPILSFDHIRHVILFRLVSVEAQCTPAVSICRWLGILFPKLERLTITCRLETHPGDDYEMDDATRWLLIKELGAACPKASTLVVANRVYNLAKVARYSV